MANSKSNDTKRTGVSGFMVKVLNEGGNALLAIYDGVSSSVTKVKEGVTYSVTKVKDGVKKTPKVTETVSKKVSTKTKKWNEQLINKLKPLKRKTIRVVKQAETKKLSEKINIRKKKIASLYYEIGKEGAKYSEGENPLETEPIQKLISDVRSYEEEISRLQQRIGKLEQEKIQEPEIKKEPPKESIRERLDQEKIAKARAARAKLEKQKALSLKATKKAPETALKKAIQNALSLATFTTPSERAKFDKVSNDLFDPENEIRMLAASEIAKLGNVAAVPILIETIKYYNDPYLTTEAINSLINLNDSQSIPLLKEKLNDPHYRVRVASLRGLYKLVKDDSLITYLVNAIRDEHPEVRKTAVTFIGWKDLSDGVAALVQCLTDDDERVKKAAISALANIRDKAAVMPLINRLNDNSLEIREKSLSAIQMIVGEQLNFNIHMSDEALPKAIQDLKVWWQQKRIRAIQDSDSEFDQPYDQSLTDDSQIETKLADMNVNDAGIQNRFSLESSKFETTQQTNDFVKVDPSTSPQEVTVEPEENATDTMETQAETEEPVSISDAQTQVESSASDESPESSIESQTEVTPDVQTESVSQDTDVVAEAQTEETTDTQIDDGTEAQTQTDDGTENVQTEGETNDSSEVTPDDGATNSLTKEELRKMPKTDLISLGQEIGVESDESLTKNRIIRNILEKQDQEQLSTNE